MAIIDRANFVADVQLEHWQYPVPTEIVIDLVELLRTEWTRSDFDWLEAMYGDYQHELTMISVIARRQDRAVATATVLFSVRTPRIALLGNVITHPEFRNRGLGRRVVEAAVATAGQAGCLACFLGTQLAADLYERCGFHRHRGVVMRQILNGDETFEEHYFFAPDPPIVRFAHWGDLPGVTLLALEPLNTLLLDYPRGLVSGRHEQLDRCISMFPVVYEDVRNKGGAMLVLGESRGSRVFGFGSVTLGAGPARSHTATIDLAVHDRFADQMPTLLERLIDECHARGVRQIEAHLAASDREKIACFSLAGFGQIAEHPSAVDCNGEHLDLLTYGLALPVAQSDKTRAITVEENALREIHSQHRSSRLPHPRHSIPVARSKAEVIDR